MIQVAKKYVNGRSDKQFVLVCDQGMEATVKDTIVLQLGDVYLGCYVIKQIEYLGGLSKLVTVVLEENKDIKPYMGSTTGNNKDTHLTGGMRTIDIRNGREVYYDIKFVENHHTK